MVIAARRGDVDLHALLAKQGAFDVVTSAVCASELLHGPHRLTNAVARARAERSAESVLSGLSIVSFDVEIARLHARLGADLASKGTAVRAHDLIVAATALWLDYRVATRDKRGFPKIPGLDVVYW